MWTNLSVWSGCKLCRQSAGKSESLSLTFLVLGRQQKWTFWGLPQVFYRQKTAGLHVWGWLMRRYSSEMLLAWFGPLNPCQLWPVFYQVSAVSPWSITQIQENELIWGSILSFIEQSSVAQENTTKQWHPKLPEGHLFVVFLNSSYLSLCDRSLHRSTSESGSNRNHTTPLGRF